MTGVNRADVNRTDVSMTVVWTRRTALAVSRMPTVNTTRMTGAEQTITTPLVSRTCRLRQRRTSCYSNGSIRLHRSPHKNVVSSNQDFNTQCLLCNADALPSPL